MTEAPRHVGLAPERWHRMPLAEQMGNIGAEVGRVLRARSVNDRGRADAALERALELIDLTLADNRLQGRRREICRAREVLLDFAAGDNVYGSDAAWLNAYYLQFGLAARG